MNGGSENRISHENRKNHTQARSKGVQESASCWLGRAGVWVAQQVVVSALEAVVRDHRLDDSLTDSQKLQRGPCAP